MLSTELAAFLNRFDFGVYEGNDVNTNTITKFINRVKQLVLIDRPLEKLDFNGIQNQELYKMFTNDNVLKTLCEAELQNELFKTGQITLTDYSMLLAILTKYGFVQNDNVYNRNFNRIYRESLQHFINRIKPMIPQLASTIVGNTTGNTSKFEEEEEEYNMPTPPHINNVNNHIFSPNQMAQQPPINVELQQLVDYYNSSAPQSVDINDIANNPNAIANMAALSFRNMRTRAVRAISKTGMDTLAHIVLDKQKDIKRRKKAMTYSGAEDIVNKRNATNLNSAPWKATIEDQNNDGIPDVLIRNGSGNPIYINGYTTARSDWPARFQLYTEYDTKAKRKRYRDEHDGKSITIPAYLKEKLGYTYNDNLAGNPYELGNMTSYAIPEGWPTKEALSRYSFPTERRKNAFARFLDYIINHVSPHVIAALVEQNIINITNKNKAALLMKGTGIIWKQNILQRVANRHRMNVNSEVFQKTIKKKTGKQEVDNEVSSLLLHILHTNGEHWTKDNQAALQNKIYVDFAHALVQASQELTRKEQQEGREERSDYINNQFLGRMPENENNKHDHNQEKGEWHDGITQAYNKEHDGEWIEDDDEAWLN